MMEAERLSLRLQRLWVKVQNYKVGLSELVNLMLEGDYKRLKNIIKTYNLKLQFGMFMILSKFY